MILSVCDVPEVLKVIKIVNLVITIIKILVPIILIITCMIDYMSAVGNNDIEKTNKRIVRKIIAAIIIFFVPTIINIIFDVVDPNNKTYISCLNNASDNNITSLYKTNMDKYMEEARSKKDNASYQAARNYLSNIKDPELRDKYYKELEEIKKSFTKDDDNDDHVPTNPTNPSGEIVDGGKYNLSDSDIEFLTTVCICEQGTLDGIAAEASLMANLFEMQGKYSSIVDYVKKSGWFACSSNDESANSKQMDVVRDVLVNGNRTLPLYINEHDCINCTKKECDNGNRGDICYLKRDGKEISSMSEIKNRSNYVSGETVIYNRYGSVYTFYTFPCESCDPFGYTKSAYNKYN